MNCLFTLTGHSGRSGDRSHLNLGEKPMSSGAAASQNAPPHPSMSDSQESCLLGSPLESPFPWYHCCLGSLGSDLGCLVTFQVSRVLPASLSRMLPLGVGGQLHSCKQESHLLSRVSWGMSPLPFVVLSSLFQGVFPLTSLQVAPPPPDSILIFTVFHAAWTSPAFHPSNLSPLQFKVSCRPVCPSPRTHQPSSLDLSS